MALPSQTQLSARPQGMQPRNCGFPSWRFPGTDYASMLRGDYTPVADIASPRRLPAQPLALRAGGIEVLRREPALERRLACRPLGLEHGEPGGVAAAPLDDHVVAKDALVAEAEPQRGAARGCIERIAFPFVAAIAERLEGIAGEE